MAVLLPGRRGHAMRARWAACCSSLLITLFACSGDEETTPDGEEATSGAEWDEADGWAKKMPAGAPATPQAGVTAPGKAPTETDFRPKIADAPPVQTEREAEALPTGPSPWGAPDAQSGAALPPRAKMSSQAARFHNEGLKASAAGDYAAAKTAFESAIAQDPKAFDSIFNLGVIYDRQGQTNKALETYARALRVQPDFEKAVEGTANIYLRQGSAAQAVSYVQPIATRWERNLYLQALLAQTLIEANRIDEAEQAARKALRRDERFAPAMLALANASMKRGRLELADSIIEQAIPVEPNYAEMHFLQGKRHQQEGRLAQALDSYRKAVQLRPDYAEARTALGMQYMAAGNYPQALTEFEATARLVPTQVAAHLNLGDAYRANRRWQDAKREFDSALRMQDNLPEAHFNLGLLYMEAGAEFPGMQLLDALQRAVLEFSTYREQMGARLGKTDPAATFIADLQRQIDRERKRIERDKARADRAARQGAEAK